MLRTLSGIEIVPLNAGFNVLLPGESGQISGAVGRKLGATGFYHLLCWNVLLLETLVEKHLSGDRDVQRREIFTRAAGQLIGSDNNPQRDRCLR